MKQLKIERLPFPSKRRKWLILCCAVALVCVLAAIGLLVALLVMADHPVFTFTGALSCYLGLLVVCLGVGLTALKMVQKTREELAAAENASSVPRPMTPQDDSNSHNKDINAENAVKTEEQGI